MKAKDFLMAKFPLWESQERGPFNTVSLREENLLEAMEEYAQFCVDFSNDIKKAKHEREIGDGHDEFS